MNSPTITMDQTAAAAKLQEYSEAAKRDPDTFGATDRNIVKGLRALAKGKRLIDVNEAIVAGGLNAERLPRLAIARAHAQNAFLEEWGGITFYWHDDRVWNSYRTSDRFCWKLPRDAFGREIPNQRFTAPAPFIPPAHRPKHKLENYFLLWEAVWKPAPPRDPYLLRPIVGSLMEIVAEWDVTDLEAAAVRQATRRG